MNRQAGLRCYQVWPVVQSTAERDRPTIGVLNFGNRSPFESNGHAANRKLQFQLDAITLEKIGQRFQSFEPGAE